MSLRLSRDVLRHFKGRSYGTSLPALRHDVVKTGGGHGIKVAMTENQLPLSHLTIIARGGSRYEQLNELGLCHYLRANLTSNTPDKTCYSIQRDLEDGGGYLKAVTTRDYMIYTLSVPSGSFELPMLAFEKIFASPKVQMTGKEKMDNVVMGEVQMLKEQENEIAYENLHKAAYRYGLGNSLYCSEDQVGSISLSMIEQFKYNHLNTKNIAVVGIGMDQGAVLDFTEALELEVVTPQAVGSALEFITGQDKLTQELMKRVAAGLRKETLPQKSTFFGGELHRPTSSNNTTVLYAKEAPSLSSDKDVMAAGLLQMMLGWTNRCKYGAPQGNLLSAIHQVNPLCSGHSFNINYTDSGLFGFSVNGPGQEMDKVLRSALNAFNKTLTNVKEGDLQKAKKQLKFYVADKNESADAIIFELAHNTLNNIENPASPFQIIDSLTLDDVVRVGQKIKSSKSALSTTGNLKDVPVLATLE